MADLIRRGLRTLVSCCCLIALLPAAVAHAYGVEGHLIAGRVAEPLLCEAADAAVTRLSDGEDLGEIGLWADRIRSDPDYADAAPWHYINLSGDRLPSRVAHPPEGDVLWAIAYFEARLRDPLLDARQHEEALRFLVHFVVDLHQPLHVGLAEDRGGNSISLRFKGETTNLHRYWDTHAIESSELSVAAYARMIAADALQADAVSLDPLDWAAESLALREQVYAFGAAGAEPPAAYQADAEEITRDRLALAASRLAGTLNAIFCPD